MSKYYYIITIQYLGFRFHGWAKHKELKTVHAMIDKTLGFVFGHSNFKTLGASRTDAMVSANESIFELFVDFPIDEGSFMDSFNSNLPPDIKALSIEQTDADFNIINTPRIKEYVYLFAFGQKAHPFSAPFITTLPCQLDIEVMKKGALLFTGKHDFRKYCSNADSKQNTEREILESRIETNNLLSASFFPTDTYAFHVHGTGFMYNQIRLLMGQLFELGKGNISIEEIENSFTSPGEEKIRAIAPASGLMLNRIRAI